MPRFKVDKLIRDRLPEIMRKRGIQVHERFMEPEEFVARLKEKLLEEAGEVKQARNQAELTEELADLLEVIYSLSKASGISQEQLERARLEKRKAKGGFDQKIYNPFVEIEESNLAIQYYLQRAEQYPLMQDPPECLFCKMARRERTVSFFQTFPHCFAIQDEFPVSQGHILIIPHEHTENWFTAREEVRLDMVKALHHLKGKLDLEYSPHGYNIGANCGEVAGQSVMHLHLHLIPRYRGDLENPKGSCAV